MKTSKFTDAQKAFILKQGAEGNPEAETCREAGSEPLRDCRKFQLLSE